MGINNHRQCLLLTDHKNYQRPALWVFKLQQVKMICGSGNESYEGGGANEDRSFSAEDHNQWDPNEDRNLWDKED